MVADVEAWHWRQALQIASQVPEGKADALIVLECVRQLIELCHQSPPTAPDDDSGRSARLLRFPRD